MHQQEKIQHLQHPRICNRTTNAGEATENMELHITGTLTLLRPVEYRDGKKHHPVLLHGPVADHLLTVRTVCLGFKEGSIKYYVSITICDRYLEYNYVAAACKGTQRCSLCTGSHIYTECKSKIKLLCVHQVQRRKRSLDPHSQASEPSSELRQMLGSPKAAAN